MTDHYRRWGKRTLDVAVSALALLVLSPILVTIAVLVRTRMGAPVLFRQQRPGLMATPFTLVKFRTMTDARDRSGKPLTDDARLTGLGRAMRSLSLDELPELWNVLVGDMSLVGPRPLLTQYLPRYSPRQARRHEVRPGITGLAQVAGRNELSWDARLQLDVEYVERLSAGLDLSILLRTAGTVVTRKGISAEGHATMPEFLGSDETEPPGQDTALAAVTNMSGTRPSRTGEGAE